MKEESSVKVIDVSILVLVVVMVCPAGGFCCLLFGFCICCSCCFRLLFCFYCPLIIFMKLVIRRFVGRQSCVVRQWIFVARHRRGLMDCQLDCIDWLHTRLYGCRKQVGGVVVLVNRPKSCRNQ